MGDRTSKVELIMMLCILVAAILLIVCLHVIPASTIIPMFGTTLGKIIWAVGSIIVAAYLILTGTFANNGNIAGSIMCIVFGPVVAIALGLMYITKPAYKRWLEN